MVFFSFFVSPIDLNEARDSQDHRGAPLSLTFQKKPIFLLSAGARAAMEDAHVGVVDVCEHFGVELCSGCGVGGGRGGERSRGVGEREQGAAAGGSSSGGSSGGASAPAPAAAPPGGLAFFGVFDGHGGGGAAAAFAASRLLDLVVAPGREALAADPEGAMSAAFGRLDLEFYRYATANASASEAGRGEEEAAAAAEETCGGETCGGAPPSAAAASTPLRDCGSTALAALLCGTTLVVANAGDSRAVLCSRTSGSSRGARSEKSFGGDGTGGNGSGNGTASTTTTPPQPQPLLLRPPQPSSSTSTFRQLTVDHKPSLPSERTRIEAAGGRVCPEGFLNSCLGVARAIGDFSPADGLKWLAADGRGFCGPLTSAPDVVTHAVTEDDEFLLVACDGLWDVLPSARAAELARQHLRAERGDPARAAAALVRHALSLHASDNVTALLLCFGPLPPPQQQQQRLDPPDAAADAAAADAAPSSTTTTTTPWSPAPPWPRPPPPASSSSSSGGRPARSLSRNSLSTLSVALASCERGPAATAGAAVAATAAAAALLLPPLAPPPPRPAVVVVAGGGGGSGGGGAKRVVPSSPAFLLGGSSGSQSEGEGAEEAGGGRPPRSPSATNESGR